MTSVLPQTAKVQTAKRPEQHVDPARPKANSVRARVRYVKPAKPGESLHTYVYQVPEGIKDPDNLEHTSTEVDITNIRQHDHTFNLLENGFQLVDFHVPSDVNWDEDTEIKSRYYPLASELLKQHSGATRVLIFDHTIRKGRSLAEAEKPGERLQKAGSVVSRVHTDYTTFGGPSRLRALLPDEAEKLSQTPFAVYQIWRPLNKTVEESPLGFIDAATLAPEDLNVHRVEFPGRTGYNYAVSPNPDHRWYYTKSMTPEEAYVFVEYESRKGRARFTPHTGFKDPTSSPDALPRESIEMRAFVFWENDKPQPPEMEL